MFSFVLSTYSFNSVDSLSNFSVSRFRLACRSWLAFFAISRSSFCRGSSSGPGFACMGPCGKGSGLPWDGEGSVAATMNHRVTEESRKSRTITSNAKTLKLLYVPMRVRALCSRWTDAGNRDARKGVAVPLARRKPEFWERQTAKHERDARAYIS